MARRNRERSHGCPKLIAVEARTCDEIFAYELFVGSTNEWWRDGEWGLITSLFSLAPYRSYRLRIAKEDRWICSITLKPPLGTSQQWEPESRICHSERFTLWFNNDEHGKKRIHIVMRKKEWINSYLLLIIAAKQPKTGICDVQWLITIHSHHDSLWKPIHFFTVYYEDDH